MVLSKSKKIYSIILEIDVENKISYICSLDGKSRSFVTNKLLKEYLEIIEKEESIDFSGLEDFINARKESENKKENDKNNEEQY